MDEERVAARVKAIHTMNNNWVVAMNSIDSYKALAAKIRAEGDKPDQNPIEAYHEQAVCLVAGELIIRKEDQLRLENEQDMEKSP